MQSIDKQIIKFFACYIKEEFAFKQDFVRSICLLDK